MRWNTFVIRLMLITLLAGIMSVLGAATNPRATSALACTSGACSGRHLWIGGTWGVKSRITIVQAHVSGGRITNFARVQGNSAQFVEAGTTAEGGALKWFYFANNIASGGYDFIYLSSIASSEIGKNLYVSIWKNSNSWSIELDSTGSYYQMAYSTPNFMNASEIFIGQLNTSSNPTSNAATASFAFNQYKSGTTGLWYDQIRPDPMPSDADYVNYPVQAGWTTKPSNSLSGGVWFARTP